MWTTIKMDVSELTIDELVGLKNSISKLIDKKEQEITNNNIISQIEHDIAVLKEMFPLFFAQSRVGDYSQFCYSCSGTSMDGTINVNFSCSKNVVQYGDVRTICSIGLVDKDNPYDERIYIPYNPELNRKVAQIKLGNLKKQDVVHAIYRVMTDLESHIQDCENTLENISKIFVSFDEKE